MRTITYISVYIEASGYRSYNIAHSRASQWKPLLKEVNEWMSEWEVNDCNLSILQECPTLREAAFKFWTIFLSTRATPEEKDRLQNEMKIICAHCFPWEQTGKEV